MKARIKGSKKPFEEVEYVILKNSYYVTRVDQVEFEQKTMEGDKYLPNKEVDLNEEVKKYINDNFTSAEKSDEFLTTVMQLDDMLSFAKHFFELGINSKK